MNKLSPSPPPPHPLTQISPKLFTCYGKSCIETFILKHSIFGFAVQINVSELARKCGASDKTKLRNMVVKEFLCKNGVDLGKFKSHRKNDPALRRQLNKAFGGEITTPVPRTSAAIRETLRQKNCQQRI